MLRKNEPPIDPSSVSTSAITTDRTKLSSDDRKSQDTTDSVNKDSISSDRDISSRLSADVSSNLRRTNSALDSDSSSLSSWRRSRDIEGSKKEVNIWFVTVRCVCLRSQGNNLEVKLEFYSRQCFIYSTECLQGIKFTTYSMPNLITDILFKIIHLFSGIS